MNTERNRREFLTDVGRGMLIATVGSSACADLGLASAVSAGEPDRLSFGEMDGLIDMMEATEPNRIVGAVVDQWKSGVAPRKLITAAALANARTLGGEDYVGFHTMMALAPALHMAKELPESEQLLPILKVLHRNTKCIQESGLRSHPAFGPVSPASLSAGNADGEALREKVRAKDMIAADQTFAALAARGPGKAFNDLLFAVQDNTEVHRTVLPYRVWDLLGLIGLEHAQALLRQSVHYCVKSEQNNRHTPETDRPRVLLPRLLDEYHLLAKPTGTRAADDAWVEHLSRTIFEGTPDQAATAVAAALAEGFDPASIGEAICLAANQLVLRDSGRTARDAQPNKPVGSVHGDSIGVHACDSANAWRNMASISNPRNRVACLILGGYQVALDRVERGGDFLHWSPRPLNQESEKITDSRPDSLLGELDTAIRSNDQGRACAITYRFATLKSERRPIFDRLLKFAVSEDGALHAEKFYRTVTEEYRASRPAFQVRHLVALARVTASEYGRPAPGVAEGRDRLGLA